MGISANAAPLAAAVMAGWAGSTVFWLGAAGALWRILLQPRFKELQDAQAAERQRCNDEIEALRVRVRELETILLIKPPKGRRVSTVGARPRVK